MRSSVSNPRPQEPAGREDRCPTPQDVHNARREMPLCKRRRCYNRLSDYDVIEGYDHCSERCFNACDDEVV